MTPRGRLDRLRVRVVLGVVVVGALSAATIGGVVTAVSLVGAVTAVVGRLRSPSEGSWRGANIAVFIAALLGVLTGSYAVEVGAALVAWLQLHRACTGRSPSDDRVAILLALLQVLVACLQSISGLLAPLFIAFAVLVPIALLLSHIVEAAPESLDPTSGRPPGLGGLWTIGPATALLTVLMFFSLPRLEAGGIGGGDQVGIGDEVRIGSPGDLKDNPELALRATIRRSDGTLLTGPFYFRGTAFDHFDGERWVSTLRSASERAAVGRMDHPEAIRQEILLEPLQGGVLVGLPGVVRIDYSGLGRPLRDLNAVWRQKGDSVRRSYTVWSVPPDIQDRPDPMRKAVSRTEAATLRSGVWTSLPDSLDPRVAELANTVITDAGAQGDSLAEARALEAWLRSEFAYTLVPEPALGAQPLSQFLFDSRRGHCEYFATALAVTLRTRGIPSRVVGGFYGGEPNPFADWVLVRQSDAHAWVEAWIDGKGWVQLDATPAAAASDGPRLWSALIDLASARWQALILDYSLETQIRGVLDLVGWMGGARLPVGQGMGTAVGVGVGGTVVLLVVGGMVLIGLGLGLRGRFSRAPVGRVAKELRRARTSVSRKGWDIPGHLTPVAAAQWLVTRAGDFAEPLLELSWLHYRVRYTGDVALDRSLASEAQALRKQIQRALPRRHRG